MGIPKLSAEELDDLPYGAIKLNAAGIVISYNRAEESFSGRRRERVIGRNFFAEIAPCSQVKTFQGRFNRFLGGTQAIEQFQFDYLFAAESVRVHLVFVRVEGEEALVMVSKRVSSEQ
jgi:photoactive yellow protein